MDVDDEKPRTWVEKNQTVGADEVDTTATSLATEEEDELLAFGIVELIDELLTLRDVHRAVESEVPIPEERIGRSRLGPMVQKLEGGYVYSLLAAQHLLENVESLGIITDEDDLVVRLCV